ncbi:MAG: MCP four helix bundle domain-containing protein [Planctomycetota bacterium]|jgi:hypothetical protein
MLEKLKRILKAGLFTICRSFFNLAYSIIILTIFIAGTFLIRLLGNFAGEMGPVKFIVFKAAEWFILLVGILTAFCYLIFQSWNSTTAIAQGIEQNKTTAMAQETEQKKKSYARKLFKPFYNFPFFSWALIIGLTIQAVYAQYELAKLTLRNGDDGLVVAQEMKEHGPKCAISINDQIEILNLYWDYVGEREPRTWSRFLVQFYPQLSPQKQIKPIVDRLKLAAKELSGDDDACKQAINKEAEEIDKFCKKSREFFGLEVVPSEHRVLSKELSGILNLVQKLADSNEAIDNYEANPYSFDYSELACRANRKAIVPLYFIRCVYQEYVKREEIEKFLKNIERAIVYNDNLRKDLGTTDKHKKLLKEYNTSEKARKDIVQAILAGDMPKATNLLIERMRNSPQVAVRDTEKSGSISGSPTR